MTKEEDPTFIDELAADANIKAELVDEAIGELAAEIGRSSRGWCKVSSLVVLNTHLSGRVRVTPLDPSKPMLVINALIEELPTTSEEPPSASTVPTPGVGPR